jgi:hypothetical protein
VWFAIPSASVERCRDRLPAWREAGYRIAVLQNEERGDIPADIVHWCDRYPGWAESINILCRDIVPASADIVVSGGDDMLPDPVRDATRLADEYFERFPDGFGVMQPAGDDYMWSRNYCGSPWFGRKFFTTMYGGAGPMHGGYRHNWADYELYWVARCLGVLWMRDNAAQYHAHFTREGEEQPAWWTRNVSGADRSDCALFLARKNHGFPGHQPVGRQLEFDTDDLIRNEVGMAESKWTRMYCTASVRMRDALARLATSETAPVAVYGAGEHTRRAADALADPPVDLVGIVDDDANRHGQTLWGYPIMSPEDAVRAGVRALVLSSNSFEEALWTRCEHLRAAGVEVVRLYEPAPSPAVAEVAL